MGQVDTPISGLNEVEARRSLLFSVRRWYELTDHIKSLNADDIAGMHEDELIAITEAIKVQGMNIDRLMDHIDDLSEAREEVNAAKHS
jgi:hypothetical protein